MQLKRLGLGIRFDFLSAASEREHAQQAFEEIFSVLTLSELEGLLIYGGQDPLTDPAENVFLAVIMGGSLSTMRRIYEKINADAAIGMYLAHTHPFIENNRLLHWQTPSFYGEVQKDGTLRGGDGTLDEVVSGMMESERKCPIGYIPAGSTNDFADSLKLPKDMVAAAKRITEFNEFPCDIGCFNDDYFVYVAAFGLFTDVSYETSQDLKNALGHMAYLLEGAKKLTNIKSYHMTVRVDDELEVSGEYIYGMVTNSTSVGGFKNITGKDVKLDDGMFELTLVKMPKNLVELQAIIGAMLTQTADDKYFFQTRGHEIELISEEPVPWALDGEYGGEHTDVFVRDAEKALTLLV